MALTGINFTILHFTNVLFHEVFDKHYVWESTPPG